MEEPAAETLPCPTERMLKQTVQGRSPRKKAEGRREEEAEDCQELEEMAKRETKKTHQAAVPSSMRVFGGIRPTPGAQSKSEQER